MAGSPETVGEVTSANFNGLIALTTPKSSWVAKWQRVDGYVPGMYAVQVIGTLPNSYVQDLQDAGVRYVPRDGPRDEDQGGEEWEVNQNGADVLYLALTRGMALGGIIYGVPEHHDFGKQIRCCCWGHPLISIKHIRGPSRLNLFPDTKEELD